MVQSQQPLSSHPAVTVRDAGSVVQVAEAVLEVGAAVHSEEVDEVVEDDSMLDKVLVDEVSC